MSASVSSKQNEVTRKAGIVGMYQEVLKGLSKSRKELPSKYFYDERGSRLFDEITRLEEYYPTRTETEIMRQNMDDMSRHIGKDVMMIEYGSGSSEKTKILLDHIKGIVVYVPIDISCRYLAHTASRLAAAYPRLEVKPLCADYTLDFTLPDAGRPISRKIVFYPGSTIGNFHPDEAVAFLKHIAEVCGEKGGALVGVDLKKDPAILNDAYNDKKGITAEFNMNQLVRLNRELGSDFDLEAFEHRAFYNDKEGRVEMHIVSKANQEVTINGTVIPFEKGETIWTESSYKYTPQEFAGLAAKAGFDIEKIWTDKNELFSVQFLTVQ